MIRTNTANCRKSAATALVALVHGALVFAGCGNGEEQKDITLDAGTVQCERDDHSKPENAAALPANAPTTGYVCPEGDRDWYKIEVPTGQTILDVSLAMAVPLSPVEASYTVWTIDDEGGAGNVAAAPPFTAVGTALEHVHCMEPGEYLLSVSDGGDDSADLRNSYELSVETSADGDQNEPNNTKESATALNSGQTATGFVTLSLIHI